MAQQPRALLSKILVISFHQLLYLCEINFTSRMTHLPFLSFHFCTIYLFLSYHRYLSFRLRLYAPVLTHFSFLLSFRWCFPAGRVAVHPIPIPARGSSHARLLAF